MKYNFRITTLDRYIIKKFIGTFFFAILLIIGIVSFLISVRRLMTLWRRVPH